MTYFDYNSENPYYLYTHIHGYRTKVYTPEIGGAPKELKAATDAALKIRLYRPELKDVPLAENPDWPTEQDFIRLEQWFISAQEPPEVFPMDEREPEQKRDGEPLVRIEAAIANVRVGHSAVKQAAKNKEIYSERQSTKKNSPYLVYKSEVENKFGAHGKK